jgi:hypothetical protein
LISFVERTDLHDRLSLLRFEYIQTEHSSQEE